MKPLCSKRILQSGFMFLFFENDEEWFSGRFVCSV